MGNSKHKHIGILGGTFDPIHIAHLRLAIDLKMSTNLSEILFIPNFIPPHKNSHVTDIKHRLAMLNLATSSLKDIIVDSTEIDIAKEKLVKNPKYRSYMVDTLSTLHEKYQKKYEKYSLWLILGEDSFAKFDTWHKWQDILTKCNFIILKRENQVINTKLNWLSEVKDIVTVNNTTQSYILPSDINNGYIYLKNSRMLDISATEIRKLFSENHSAKFLAPDNVIEYIERNNLYK